MMGVLINVSRQRAAKAAFEIEEAADVREVAGGKRSQRNTAAPAKKPVRRNTENSARKNNVNRQKAESEWDI